eukprot:TRINITY_DN12367_c0_g1_i1.p1 TRINITY_DN12367_c0_g1~~TRINITY_DN12367_c0_g1_i1.p1  ORF type:complete len:284 (-),score=87.63 TRINITY_DN12367_c0_g1_i1:57-908(-)
MATEEERLNRMMNKKSEEAFEKARREALQKYQKSAGGAAKEFHLAEKEKPKEKAPVAAPVFSSIAAQETVHEKPQGNNDWKQDYERRAQEEKLREEEESRRRQSALSALTTDSHDDLGKWKAEQDRKEQEFRKKLEEEERRKKEELERMKAQALREHQQREEEVKREQAARLAAQPAPAQLSSNQCTACHKQLTDILDIFFVNDKKFCQPCSVRALNDKPGGQGKCAHCKFALDSTFIKAAGSKFHPECFICSDCGKQIQGGFRPKGRNTFTCANCGGALGFN